jgi:hypothetical protein
VTSREPKRALKPEDLLDFIELPVFTRRWEKLGLDDEEDLTALQLTIMMAPKAGKPISGTKGIRKLRFAPARWKTGKSGAARVLYVYFEEFGIVILALIYGKDEVDDISAAVKKYLNSLVDEIERELRRRKSRGIGSSSGSDE